MPKDTPVSSTSFGLAVVVNFWPNFGLEPLRGRKLNFGLWVGGSKVLLPIRCKGVKVGKKLTSEAEAGDSVVEASNL